MCWSGGYPSIPARPNAAIVQRGIYPHPARQVPLGSNRLHGVHHAFVDDLLCDIRLEMGRLPDERFEIGAGGGVAKVRLAETRIFGFNTFPAGQRPFAVFPNGTSWAWSRQN